MRPAFFRPEVLSKYKADSDKYTLGDSSISCRGAWHLDTYDVNEAGQVHTYLVYLRKLPYEEQLDRKAHNEPPKGPISERARRADFEGRWTFDYDPLISLRDALRGLREQMVPWWTLRSDDLIEQVHYPVTEGAETADGLLRRRDLLAFHCTNLHPAEITGVTKDGLVPLDTEMVARRVQARVAAGDITEPVGTRFLAETMAGDENRSGLLRLILTRSTLSHWSGVYRLLTCWGGEALYAPHEDDAGQCACQSGLVRKWRQ